MRYAPEIEMDITALLKGECCWVYVHPQKVPRMVGKQFPCPLNSPRDRHNCFFIVGRQSTIITGNFFNQKKFNLIKFMTLTWNSQKTKNWIEKEQAR